MLQQQATHDKARVGGPGDQKNQFQTAMAVAGDKMTYGCPTGPSCDLPLEPLQQRSCQQSWVTALKHVSSWATNISRGLHGPCHRLTTDRMLKW